MKNHSVEVKRMNGFTLKYQDSLSYQAESYYQQIQSFILRKITSTPTSIIYFSSLG
jgi:hypothetical protein